MPETSMTCSGLMNGPFSLRNSRMRAAIAGVRCRHLRRPSDCSAAFCRLRVQSKEGGKMERRLIVDSAEGTRHRVATAEFDLGPLIVAVWHDLCSAGDTEGAVTFAIPLCVLADRAGRPLCPSTRQ